LYLRISISFIRTSIGVPIITVFRERCRYCYC